MKHSDFLLVLRHTPAGDIESNNNNCRNHKMCESEAEHGGDQQACRKWHDAGRPSTLRKYIELGSHSGEDNVHLPGQVQSIRKPK